MTNSEKLAILQRHVNELAEIYDAVQVFATGLDSDGTTFSHKRGSGNFYARQGMAHEFIQSDISQERAAEIARALEPPEDWKIVNCLDWLRSMIEDVRSWSCGVHRLGHRLITEWHSGSIPGSATNRLIFWLLLTLLFPSLLLAQQSSVRELDNISQLAGQVQDLNRTRFVRGYSSSGDGGGGLFVFTNTIASTNLGTRFRVTGQNYSWERQHDGRVNIRWFGAKGGSGNDSPSIQAALDYASSNSLGVYVPPGQFKVQSVVNLPNNAVLFGDGNDSELVLTATPSAIVATGTTNIAITRLRFSGTYSRGVQVSSGSQVTVKDCDFSGSTVVPGSGFMACFNADTSTEIRVLGSRFHDNGGASAAVNFNGGSVCIADNNWIVGSAFAIRSAGRTNSVTGNRNWSTGGIGVSVLGGDSTLVSGNVVYGTPTFGIYLDASSSNCVVTANRIYGNSTAAIEDFGGFNTISDNLCLGGAVGISGDGDSGLILANVVEGQVTGLQTAGSRYRVDPLGRYHENAIPINDSGGSIVKTITSGTTPSVRDSSVYLLSYAAPTTITDFTDGLVGMRRTFFGANPNVTITNSGSIRLDGASSVNLKAGDSLVLERDSAGAWRQVGRSINGPWMHYDRSIERMIVEAPLVESNRVIQSTSPSTTIYPEDRSVSSNTVANTLIARWQVVSNVVAFAFQTDALKTNTIFTFEGIRYVFPRTNGVAGQVLASDGGNPQHLYWTNTTGGGSSFVFDPTQFSVDGGGNVALTNGVPTTNQFLKGQVHTQILDVPGVNIDAATGTEFSKILASNTSMGILNVTNGEQVSFTVTNTTFTLSFTNSNITWISGQVPVIDTNAVNVFHFWGIGGGILGSDPEQKANANIVGLSSMPGIGVVVKTNASAFTTFNPLPIVYGGTGTNSLAAGSATGNIPFHDLTKNSLDVDDGLFTYGKFSHVLNLARSTPTGQPQLVITESSGSVPLMSLYANRVQEANDDLFLEALTAGRNIYGQIFGTTGFKLSPDLSFIAAGGSTVTTRSNQFLYISTSAGAPTGTPVTEAGHEAMDYDTVGKHLYVYQGGWNKIDYEFGDPVPVPHGGTGTNTLGSQSYAIPFLGPSLDMVLTDTNYTLPNAFGTLLVNKFATGGDGSAASPWTGWDSAIDFSRSNFVARFPTGYYQTAVGGVKVQGQRVWLVGDGPQNSIIVFPAQTVDTNAAVTFFCVSSSQSQSGIKGFGFRSPDTTHTKAFLRVRDCGEFTATDLGSVSGDWVGNGSIAVQTRGRQFIWIEKSTLAADIPISIEKNDGLLGTTISFDHSHVLDCWLVAKSGSTNACIQVQDGVYLTDSTFERISANNGGGLFRQIDTSAAAANINVVFHNIRQEQATAGSTYMIDLESTAVAFQGLTIRNLNGGTGINGIKLRTVKWGTVDEFTYYDTSKVAVDLDSSDVGLTFIGGFRNNGSTVSLGTAQYTSVASLLPSDGYPVPNTVLSTLGNFTSSVLTPVVNGSISSNGSLTITGTSHGSNILSLINLQPTGGKVIVGTGPVGPEPFAQLVVSDATYNTPVKIGRELNTAYGSVSLNGTNTFAGSLGLIGTSSDKTLFLVSPSGGGFSFRIANNPVMRITSDSSTVVGDGTTTTTRTNIFLYVPTTAGPPTGTPVTETGVSPIAYDTVNTNLYVYTGNAWRAVAVGGDGWFAQWPTNSQLNGDGFANRLTGTNGVGTSGGTLLTQNSLAFVNNGGAGTVANTSSSRLSHLDLKGGSNAESWLAFFAANAAAGIWDTNKVLEAFFGVHASDGVFTNTLNAQNIGASKMVRTDSSGNFASMPNDNGILFDGTTIKGDNIYANVNVAQVANTTTEGTILPSSFKGLETMQANFFTAGKTLHIYLRGLIRSTAAPTLRIKLKAGSTVLADTGATTLASSGTFRTFDVDLMLTCGSVGASGLFYANGSVRYFSAATTQNNIDMPDTALPSSSINTLDTTATQTLDVTATWGTADTSNDLKIYGATMTSVY